MSKNPQLHVALAEQAKLYHLEGKATLALLYLRESLKQVERSGSAAIIARYYSQLSLEVLESEGHYEDVINYCDNAIAHYQTHPPASPLATRDLAEAWQRRGVCELRLERTLDASESFKTALSMSTEFELPVARTLLGWVSRHFQITGHSLRQLLNRHHYFSIRPDTLDRQRAMKVPYLEAIAL